MKHEIAVYWWAFNPPTLWHFGVVEKLLTSNKVQKIIFTPDGERSDKNYEILSEKRQKMIQIFFEEMLKQWFNVEMEKHFLFQKNTQTTTMDVQEYFEEKLWKTPTHIFWVDVIESMPNWVWNKDNYLEQHLKKIFLMRKGFDVPEMKNFQNFEILDFDILEISSTTVREMIKNKLRVEHILTPKVHEFVMDEKLYV